MPKGKRGKAFKLGLDTSKGQQNQIGIVNKQKSTDPNASGQNKRTVKDGVKWRNDGRTGEGPVRPTKQTPKPTKTKTTKTKAVEKGPSKKVKPTKVETEGKYTITKRSAAHTRTGHAENTQTYKVASRGRYRGRGVVDKF